MKTKIWILSALLAGLLPVTIAYQRAYAKVPMRYSILLCNITDPDSGAIIAIGNTCGEGENPVCYNNPCENYAQ